MYQERIVSICNSADGCRAKAENFDRKVLVWIYSFMTMMVMMMVSCIAQWTCTIGKIFRNGAESCSKRNRGWLPACCFIECYIIGIDLFYVMDDLPNFKFSEMVMQIMWAYVVMFDVLLKV